MVSPHKLLAAFLITISAMISSHSQAAELMASVNYKEVTVDESVKFSLQYEGNSRGARPDFAPLKNSFRILSLRPITQNITIQNKRRFISRWDLTLKPLRQGRFIIPAFQLAGQSSDPITITVKARGAQLDRKQAYFSTSVSNDQIYVQSQLIYTERLFYDAEHQNHALSELKVEDATVFQLGKTNNYSTVINGQRVTLYERKYLIYPEASGELVIPGARFEADAYNPYDRSSRVRRISAVAKPIRIPVLPIPENYPKAPWLPSSKLTIQESYSNTDRKSTRLNSSH